MVLRKRTYSLPQLTLDEFEKAVPPGERSTMVARLMRQWLDQRERERLRREVIEGCHDMAEVYLSIEREFHPLEEEVQHALDPLPKSRRNRSRSARPRGGIGTGG
jgi:hypothetical protein